MTALAAAQEEVQQIADGLEALRRRLQNILVTLPESAAEAGKRVDLEEMDPAVEMRAVIGCVLTDSLGPAIRDLCDVLLETAGAGEPEP